MQKQYYVYLMMNKRNTVIYTGVTDNLERRTYEHKKKLVSGFTQKYNVDKLVYFQKFNSPEEAISAEKKIKGWLRKKKMDLIKSINPEFRDLAE